MDRSSSFFPLGNRVITRKELQLIEVIRNLCKPELCIEGLFRIPQPRYPDPFKVRAQNVSRPLCLRNIPAVEVIKRLLVRNLKINPRLLRLPDHNTRIEQINPAASACAPAPGVALEQVHTSSGHSETLEQVDPEPLSVLLLLPGEPLSLPLVELPQPVGLKRVEAGLHRPPIRTGVNASVHAHNLAR